MDKESVSGWMVGIAIIVGIFLFMGGMGGLLSACRMGWLGY